MKKFFNAETIPNALVGASAGAVFASAIPHDAKSVLVPALMAVFVAVVNVGVGAMSRKSATQAYKHS